MRGRFCVDMCIGSVWVGAEFCVELERCQQQVEEQKTVLINIAPALIRVLGESPDYTFSFYENGIIQAMVDDNALYSYRDGVWT